MQIVNLASLSLFLIFLTSYLMKLWMLRTKGQIRANVLGKSGKPLQVRIVESGVKLATLIWGGLWFALSCFGDAWLKAASIPLGEGTLAISVTAAGVLVTALGLVFFIIAMLHMRTSWRVGIDKATSTELVMNGIYRYSRNPAFVGFDLMFIGLFLTYLNYVTLIVCLMNIIFLHLLIRQEERHLESVFGDMYCKYMRHTPRYIGLIR
ncbi:isoprenylcysteine carboxylmethyltransferase family protein [Paenibacillus lentus]|uniref:methyltransferase family protein n=1 Tax=Paenibacillus lentus TaxID=1338368 RepID=UPI0036477C29